MPDSNTILPQRRNWRSLSLRTLILLLTLAGVACGLVGRRIRVQRNQARAVNELREIGAQFIGTAQVGFEDPWAGSRYQWMHGKLTRATELDMRATDANSKDYAHAIAQLPFLKRLYLGDCLVTDEVVVAISKCRDLRRLELKDNLNITDQSADYLMRLKKLNALNVKRTRMSWESISRLATLPEMSELSFEHTFSNDDLVELGTIGRICFKQLSCLAVDADGLKNVLELENADNIWLLEVSRSRITPEWDSILSQMNIQRLNLNGCSYAPGVFDTYQLPCGEGKRKGWIQIAASQSEFDKVVSHVRTASGLHVDESPYRQRRHDNALVTIFDPNGERQRLKFDVVAAWDGLSERSESSNAQINVEALRSIKTAEELRVASPQLLAQLEPELIRSATRLQLLDDDPHRQASFIPILERASRDQPLATEILTIQSPTLRDEDFEVIARMPNLRSLTVSSPAFDGSGFVRIRSLNKLEELRFNQNCLAIEDLTVDQLVQRLRPLENLKKVIGPRLGGPKQKELLEKLGVPGPSGGP